jgi:hypothetical protein
MKSLKNIKLTNTRKIIISVFGLGLLVFLTRKYWFNLDRIYCHNPKCNWSWKVKDGGDDLYVCHKCYTDNKKFYVNPKNQ